MTFSNVNHGICSTFIPHATTKDEEGRSLMIYCGNAAVIIYETSSGAREHACFAHSMKALEAFMLVFQETERCKKAHEYVGGMGDLLLKMLGESQ